MPAVAPTVAYLLKQTWDEGGPHKRGPATTVSLDNHLEGDMCFSQRCVIMPRMANDGSLAREDVWRPMTGAGKDARQFKSGFPARRKAAAAGRVRLGDTVPDPCDPSLPPQPCRDLCRQAASGTPPIRPALCSSVHQ